MPESPFPLRYLWTWDHCTNWVLDDPGLVNFGWDNRYLKRTETFIKDYRRLIDHCRALGINGIVIWGFLRADHGGIDAAKEIVDYANERGVGIFPGVGTGSYGGFFYEGEHPYNASTWLKLHPELRTLNTDGALDADGGKPMEHFCPAKPENIKWLKEGIRWLFDTFDIAGVNLENGDLSVSHTPEAKAARAALQSDEPDAYKDQLLSYQPVLEEIRELLDEKMITYATYTGFLPKKAKLEGQGAAMSSECPLFATRLPEKSIAQWTITEMLRKDPLPLSAWLDEGEPDEVYDNPNWPRDLRPPTKRSAGLVHQGSECWHDTRYDVAVPYIKEACLRACRAGLEGMCIVGEVTSRHIPCALNYLAFSHFTRFPADSLRAFGQKTLAGEVGDEDRAVRFVEILAGAYDGLVSDKDRHDAALLAKQAHRDIANGRNVEQSRYWLWLEAMATGRTERFTSSFF